MKPKNIVCSLLWSGLLVFSLQEGMRANSSDKARAFTFTYRVAIKDIPASARKVRVWIPRASSDSNQSVVLKNASGPARLRETREARFGDHMLYAEILPPKFSSAEFTLTYDVTRKEYSKGNFESLMKVNDDPGLGRTTRK